MPTKLYTPAAAAALISVSPSTLRNWCGQFKAHLSPGATPEPGAERILTEQDVVILQRVKELRDQYRSYDDIARDLETAPPTDDTIYIDSTSTEPPQQPPTALQPVTGIDTALQVMTAIAAQRDDLQRQIDAIKTEQISRLQWFVYGVAVGILLVLGAAGVVWLGMTAR